MQSIPLERRSINARTRSNLRVTFARTKLGHDWIPDETMILNFRHLLERHTLTDVIYAEVNRHLADKGITMRSGTMVDVIIIDSPSSTKI